MDSGIFMFTTNNYLEVLGNVKKFENDWKILDKIEFLKVQKIFFLKLKIQDFYLN